MRLLRRVVERLALALLFLGGVGTLSCMFLGTGDVIGTQFAGWPVPGAKELTESTMVLIVFGALTYAQIQRGHIRVELVYSRVPPRAQEAMEIVAALAALVFFGLLLWQAIGEAAQSWRIREADVGLIRFPLYPARMVLVVGTGLLIVQLVLELLDHVQHVIGTKAMETLHAAPTIPEVSIAEDED